MMVLLAGRQYASGQFSVRQLSLCDPVADSAILFDQFDNLVMINGWKPGMDVSFSKCTLQHINKDTFNIKADFTGKDILVVKNGSKVLYQKQYNVKSHFTASVNTGLFVHSTTGDQMLESLLPMHQSAMHNRARFTFLPRLGDALVVEFTGAGKNNSSIKAICSRLRQGDKVIIEFPDYRGGQSVTIR